MGVYHISGLGRSPGALTVPLSTVYLLQIAQQLGIDTAKNFFAYSGEAERKGSQEKTRGQVECVIAFTSREVAEGGGLSGCRSKWLNLDFKSGESLENVFGKFFNKLFDYIEKEFEFRPKEFEFYVVEVKHTNFEDCFMKIGTTMKALVGKEIWANMIAGTNQTNIAILTAGAYIASVSKYYYIFQSEQQLLDPEWAERPDRKNIWRLTKLAVENWNEIPIFNLDLGKIITRLRNEFSEGEIINKGKLEQILRDLGLSKDYIPKLRSFLVLKGDIVEKSPLFERLVKLWEDLDKKDVKNFSEWIKWAESEGILRKVEIF